MKAFSALGILRSLSMGLGLLLPHLLLAEKAKPISKQTAPRAAAEGVMAPVIIHEFEVQIAQLVLLSAFEADGKRISKQEAADELYSNIAAAVEESEEEAPEAARLPGLIKDSTALIGFYLANFPSQDNQARLKTAAQWLQSFSSLYGNLSKKAGNKARALYWNALARFISSGGSEGLSDLVPLREQLTTDKEITTHIDLLLAYSLALSPATARQGLSSLNQAGKELSVYNRLAQKLTEAYVAFGLNAEGQATTGMKPGAEGKLTQAIQLARSLPPPVQHFAMNTAIFIWTHAASGKTPKIPAYLTDGFSGVIPVEALREREALAQVKAKNYQQAAAQYRAMAQAFDHTDLQAVLDKRIWELELQHYRKTGATADLAVTFLRLRDRYRDPKKPTAAAGPSYPAIAESYRKVLDQQLMSSLAHNASQELKQTTIQLVQGYLKLEADRLPAYPLKTKLAQLYRSLGMYKEAVETYLDLAKDKENPLKNYLLAVEAQSHLAAWPTQPNFDKAPAGDANERSKLLAIFETISQLKNGEDWFMLSHIGLLNRAIGQNKKAEELWLSALKNNTNSKFAMEAAGLLLAEFYAEKRWEDLIDLAHQFAARKVVPTSKSRPLNYQGWLADALYSAGMAELQTQNFARSVKHLEEFAQSFATDPRAAAATYSLAFAYKGISKLVAAINACKLVIEKYPQYNLRPKVLLQAGEWSAADKATWEYAFFFYGKYLSDYKNERNVPEIRNALADLYLKRKLYGWASRLYKDQSLAPNVAKDLQLAAAVKHMDIEEQYGEPKDAYSGAMRILQLSAASDPPALHAYAFIGRYAASNQDLKGMAEVEPKLLPFIKTSKEVQEAMGQVRFQRAELLTKAIVYTESNLLIKDPEAVVKKYFDLFESEKQHYLKVCQIGVTSFCAPAMLRLMTVAQQGLEAIDKVTIAETLGPNRVNSFKVFKQLHFTKVQQARKEYKEQAMKLARSGTTTPMWKDEIIKTLEFEQDKSDVAH